jgi:endonuclease V-like protein UPF0215 family
MSTSKQKSGEAAKIREVKPEIRVLGIDDGAFTPHSKELVDVVGVVFRGGYWLDGFMHTQVHVDGMDATERLTQMIMESPHYQQLRVVMLNGVTLAGFNVVDISELHKKTKLPIIAVTRDRPDFEDIRKALRNLPLMVERWKAIEKAGRIHKVCTRKGEDPIYAHAVGISEKMVERIMKNTSTRSNIPEPLRVAHIVASGLRCGDRSPALMIRGNEKKFKRAGIKDERTDYEHARAAAQWNFVPSVELDSFLKRAKKEKKPTL